MKEKMQSISFIAYFLIFNICHAHADYIPKCGGLYNLCGYIDAVSHQRVISFDYNRTFSFHEGLALVQKDGLFGYINIDNKFVIKPAFETAGSFYQGYAEVMVGGKVGVINKKGKFVVKPKFARAIPFTKSSVLLKKGDFVSTDNEDYSISRLYSFSDVTHLAIVSQGLGSGNFEIYNFKKDKYYYNNLQFRVFEKEGKGLIWAKRKNRELWGLFGSDGDWAIQPKFKQVDIARDGFAIVSNLSDKKGIIDTWGKMLADFSYDKISYMKSGLYRVMKIEKDRDLIGYLNTKGELAGGRMYEDISFQPSKKIYEINEGENHYCIEFGGQKVDCAGFSRGNYTLKSRLCPSGVKIKEDALGYLNVYSKNNKRLGRSTSNNLSEVVCSVPIAFNKNGKGYNFILTDGETILSEVYFNHVLPFASNVGLNKKEIVVFRVAPVAIENEWGLINQEGDFVSSVKYNYLKRSKNSKFYIGIIEDKTVYIDLDGFQIEKPKEILEDSSSIICSEGVKIFKDQRMWGIKDNDKVIIEPKYESLYCYKNGIVWVPNDKLEKWCPLGIDAEPVSYLDCIEEYYPIPMARKYPEKISQDKYRNSVIWTRTYLEYLSGEREEAPRYSILPERSADLIN